MPIIAKILQKRLRSAYLASDAFHQTLISHFSETILLKITTKKLDKVSSTTDHMSNYFDLEMSQNERIITYSLIGVIIAILIFLVIVSYTQHTALYKFYKKVEETVLYCMI